MVQRASEFIDDISDQDIKLKLIDTLRSVTVGKVRQVLITTRGRCLLEVPHVFNNLFVFLSVCTLRSPRRAGPIFFSWQRREGAQN